MWKSNRRGFIRNTLAAVGTLQAASSVSGSAQVEEPDAAVAVRIWESSEPLAGLKGPQKWDGFPLYERPLGLRSEGLDDGRGVVVISDFSACLPADSMGVEERHGRWTLQAYETERFKGRLLYAHRTNPAPELTLRLGASGWYAIYVWLMGGDVDLEPQYPADYDSVFSVSKGPALQLTGDRYPSGMFKTLSHDRMMWRGLEACFWRYEDLSGKDLVVRHQGWTVYLGAIQLVPLAPAEVDAVLKDRNDVTRKRLIIKQDRPNPAAIEPTIEHLRNRDISAWITGNESSADLLRPGVSPRMQAMRRMAREIGADWYVCDRPGLWSSHRKWDDPRAHFYQQHPEWHCKDRDGTDTHQMSYAVPEVVDYMLERLRQTVENEPAGYGYFFNRDPGLVLFELAAMSGFEERHGVDPLTLPDRDGRLISWRAGFITNFLRKSRKELDRIASDRRLPRLRQLAVVLGTKSANDFFSYDVETWVKEGLVDILCPYPWVDYPDRWLAQGFVKADVAYFARLVRGSRCRLYPMWLWGEWRQHWTPDHIPISGYFEQAAQDYSLGADGLSVWDMVSGGSHGGGTGLSIYSANRWLCLGHREALEEWTRHDFPLPPKLRFTGFAGGTPDRYPSGTGG